MVPEATGKQSKTRKFSSVDPQLISISACGTKSEMAEKLAPHMRPSPENVAHVDDRLAVSAADRQAVNGIGARPS
jgi:hypothetical protein